MKALISFASVLFVAFLANASTSMEIKVQRLENNSNLNERVVDRYSYNFGRVWLNSAQYARYKLTNTGSSPLTFQRATVGGADFSATHSCTGVLAPQQVCHFDIRFSPFFEGFNSGRFVLSFIEDLDIVVDLWGEGYRM